MVQNFIMTIQEYFQCRIYKIVNKMLLMHAGSSLKSKYMECFFLQQVTVADHTLPNFKCDMRRHQPQHSSLTVVTQQKSDLSTKVAY